MHRPVWLLITSTTQKAWLRSSIARIQWRWPSEGRTRKVHWEVVSLVGQNFKHSEPHRGLGALLSADATASSLTFLKFEFMVFPWAVSGSPHGWFRRASCFTSPSVVLCFCGLCLRLGLSPLFSLLTSEGLPGSAAGSPLCLDLAEGSRVRAHFSGPQAFLLGSNCCVGDSPC